MDQIRINGYVYGQIRDTGLIAVQGRYINVFYCIRFVNCYNVEGKVGLAQPESRLIPGSSAGATTSDWHSQS